MDLCRGSLLAQPWSDAAWLSPPERKQMAEFIALLKARPECFRNPRFVVGNPRRDEPYGYGCTDGSRAFVAVNNCSWKDNAVTLRLNSDWGLPGGGDWDIFRWYPEPAKLRGTGTSFHETAVVCLRPFEVVLLEIVPAGWKPSLDRAFDERPIPVAFATASKEVPLSVRFARDQAKPNASSSWKTLQPVRVISARGATLTPQADGSIFASGQTPSPDTYLVTADAPLTGIVGLRLEALPDDCLPGRGPGRAVNGNFALTEIRLKAFPRGRPAEAIAVPLRNPTAGFSQSSHGGWPISAALDGSAKTGWSVDPEEGQPHEAVFETQKPVGYESGTTLVVELDQGDREHSLGRFRLSATTSEPVSAPRRHEPRRLAVRGQVPASPQGGLLVVAVEMSKDGKPVEVSNVGQLFSAEGSMDGRPAAWQPVLGKATYPSCWQAWRLSLGPSVHARQIALAIVPRVVSDVDLRCRGHFVAR